MSSRESGKFPFLDAVEGLVVWKPAPEPADTEPRLVKASLEGVARRLGLAGPNVLTVVFANWSTIVGAPIAAHAKPMSLKGTELVVEVDEPAWATEMRFLHDDIVSHINQSAGSEIVTELQIRVKGAPRARQRRNFGPQGH